MKLISLHEAKKQHVAQIFGKEYRGITFQEAKRIASRFGANQFWWDGMRYVLREGGWRPTPRMRR